MKFGALERGESVEGLQIPLGHGANYIFGTGQIYLSGECVTTLGKQSRLMFETILQSPSPVDKFTLAQPGGIVEADPLFLQKRVLNPDDNARVVVTIRRIRDSLQKVSPDLAGKLQVIRGVGYVWDPSDHPPK